MEKKIREIKTYASMFKQLASYYEGGQGICLAEQ